MTSCLSIQAQFSDYLDGAVSGADMQSIAAHLQECGQCAAEFSEWRRMHRLLTGSGPLKPPADLGLRLRVAISQERARTPRRRLEAWQLYWQNSMAPVLARGAAGLASAAIMLGAIALMIGTVASPPAVAANETFADAATTPRFLYRSGNADSQVTFHTPVILQAQIGENGKVYSYRILSGPQSRTVRAELDNFLLMSRFKPSQLYGMPVSSRAILSLSGAHSQKR